MPQATQELQDKWQHNEYMDWLAMRHLEGRGFTFSRSGIIVAPEGHDFIDDDFSAIDYMCQEWDYGWEGKDYCG